MKPSSLSKRLKRSRFTKPKTASRSSLMHKGTKSWSLMFQCQKRFRWTLCQRSPWKHVGTFRFTPLFITFHSYREKWWNLSFHPKCPLESPCQLLSSFPLLKQGIAALKSPSPGLLGVDFARLQIGSSVSKQILFFLMVLFFVVSYTAPLRKNCTKSCSLMFQLLRFI